MAKKKIMVWMLATFMCFQVPVCEPVFASEIIEAESIGTSNSSLIITSQPVDYTGPVGGTAAMKVTANGSGLKYQWYVSKDSGKSWNSLGSDFARASVSFEATEARNGYSYRCVVTDVNGKSVTSNSATLKMGPTITGQPSDYTGVVGGTATMKVTANGSGLKYQWYVSKDSGKSWNSLGSDFARASVSFEATEARNGYSYRCVVTDVNGKSVTSNSATLKMGPTITGQPSDYTGVVGGTATMKVTANGSGLKYQWYVSKDSGKSWNSLGSDFARASVSFEATEARNGYSYRCVVTDVNGKSVTSNSATLKMGPTITGQPSDYTGVVGGTATMKVTANGSGLKYQWYVSKDSGKSWNSLGSDFARASVSFEATEARNGYSYRCVVTDVNGKSVTSNSATLKMGPTITGQPSDYTGVVGGTATMKVTANGSGLKYQWYVSKDSGKSWNSLGSDFARASVSFEATEARNGYSYRCVVTDVNGKSVTSNSATLKMGPTITGQPSDYTGVVGGTATMKVTANGSGLKYQWYVSKDSGKSWNSLGSDFARASVSFEATEARNGYSYRCVVTDANGKSVTSNNAKLNVIKKESWELPIM